MQMTRKYKKLDNSRDEVYKKLDNGRYEPMGIEFEGFPADGYWLVLDGRQSLLAPVEHPRPISYLRFAQYRNKLVERIVKQTESKSVIDWVDIILTELEQLNTEHLEHEENLLKLIRNSDG